MAAECSLTATRSILQGIANTSCITSVILAFSIGFIGGYLCCITTLDKPMWRIREAVYETMKLNTKQLVNTYNGMESLED